MELDQNPSGDSQKGLGETNLEGDSKAKIDKVDYSTHQRLLNQLKNQNLKLQRLQELEERFSSIETEKKIKEEEDLLKKQQYEKLLERRSQEKSEIEKRAKELEQKLQEAEKIRLDSYKLNSFYEKLPGKIKKKEYLTFVDLDSIEVDEQGRVNEDSVLRSVNDFMKDHHFLVESKSRNMPSDSPSNYAGKINYDQWSKLPLKEKKKYSPKDIYN